MKNIWLIFFERIKNMKKTHLLFFVLFATVGLLEAQTVAFSSRKLAEIDDLMPDVALPKHDSIFACAQITNNKSLIIRYNKNKVSHLGISLFSSEAKEMINKPICDFIERLALELVVQQTPAAQSKKLKEYDIRIEKAGVEIKNSSVSVKQLLEGISQPARFALEKTEARYRAVWEYGVNDVFVIDFPVNRELIFGTDKKESDEEIGKLFAGNNCSQTQTETPPAVDEKSLIRIDGTDIYRLKGRTFMIDNISSDIYYQKNGNRYYTAHDDNYPHESLSNLFFTDNRTTSLKLHITHRMYGSFTPEFDISLSDFICLFQNSCDIYCGSQKEDTDKVKLTVILHNRDYNFIHMLQINTTADQVFSKNGILDANLYTNIPQHNIKSLFNL